MYCVDLQFFDSNGHLMGTGHTVSPGKTLRAFLDFIKRSHQRTFLGFKPAYIYAVAEGGEPVLIKLEA